jgi:hypothetical protein
VHAASYDICQTIIIEITGLTAKQMGGIISDLMFDELIVVDIL